MSSFLCILKDFVSLTNKLLAAEKNCDAVLGVEWVARDGNMGVLLKCRSDCLWKQLWKPRMNVETHTLGLPFLHATLGEHDAGALGLQEACWGLWAASLIDVMTVCPTQRPNVLNHHRAEPWHWQLYPCGLLCRVPHPVTEWMPGWLQWDVPPFPGV